MTAAEWFFLQGSREAGPFTRDQIHSLLVSASINEETLIWRPGCVEWMPLSQFREFGGLPPRPLPRSSRQYNAGPTARYEERYEQVPLRSLAEDPPPASANSGHWVDETPHPWRRYFARALDNLVWGIAIMFAIGFGLALVDPEAAQQFISLFEGPGGRLIDIVLTLVLAMIPNAILIGLTGGTFGKWLFGICILDETDRPIGIMRAFHREIRVFVYGLGLGLPIVSLITNVIAYQKLKEDRATSWDQALKSRVVQRRNGVAQYIGFTIGIILLIGLFGFVVWAN